jgi:exodeoxyribonuclease-5
MITLSPPQITACDAVMKWFKSPNDQVMVLSGYAGTGKTTIARHLQDVIGNVLFCAYTGKAANVLREKGCYRASTIHSLIYHVKADENTNILSFSLNWDSPALDADLVIVDEYSMLDTMIISDLMKLCKKILCLGDDFQLTPVNGTCPLKPDFILTEVHRQALDSPILRAATDVRLGKSISHCFDGEFIFKPKSKASLSEIINADQLIVGRNDTRKVWNKRIRDKKGFLKPLPMEGEKVICLKNNKEIGLFNGMIGLSSLDSNLLKRRGPSYITLNFENFGALKVWDGDFLNTELTTKISNDAERFDYAYAITCHKSQGSEFDNIVVFNQPVGKTSVERSKWLYTAITRARTQCILLDDG